MKPILTQSHRPRFWNYKIVCNTIQATAAVSAAICARQSDVSKKK